MSFWTVFIIVPLYTTAVDFKSDNRGVNEGGPQVLFEEVLQKNWELKVIGLLTDKLFHGQVRPFPLLFFIERM